MLAYVNANFEAIKTKFIGLIQAADFCNKLMRSMAVMLKKTGPKCRIRYGWQFFHRVNDAKNMHQHSQLIKLYFSILAK